MNEGVNERMNEFLSVVIFLSVPLLMFGSHLQKLPEKMLLKGTELTNPQFYFLSVPSGWVLTLCHVSHVAWQKMPSCHLDLKNAFGYWELLIACISVAHEDERTLSEVRTLSEDLGCRMSIVVICHCGAAEGRTMEPFWILLVALLGIT